MSAPKWTPSPWEVGRLDSNGQREVRAEIEICTCWHHCVSSIERQMEANAYLIAAAPELYEALEAAYKTFYDKDCALGKQVSAALAKARGEA